MLEALQWVLILWKGDMEVVMCLTLTDCHLMTVYRLMLQHHLNWIEKKLKITLDNHHTNAGQVLEVEETTVIGIRITNSATGYYLDNTWWGLFVKVDPWLSWTSAALKLARVLLKGSIEVNKMLWYTLCTIWFVCIYPKVHRDLERKVWHQDSCISPRHKTLLAKGLLLSLFCYSTDVSS